jgi:membrane protease YdiL (CAAX protease family)
VAWHLAVLFVAGPYLAFVLLTVAYSAVFTWVHLRIRSSVLIATLLHGAINLRGSSSTG